MAEAFNVVRFSLPPSSLFTLPPNENPLPLPPPPPPSSPFVIPVNVYHAALDLRIPLVIGSLYAATVLAFNQYNRSSNKRPWAISHTLLFRVFVLVHNISLAIYSGWTFWGMINVMRRSIVLPHGPDGLVSLADSLCQINGPGGLGKATIYSDHQADPVTGTDAWQTFSPDVTLTEDGLPRTLDSGRIWNEGLAFYGWIFYLSKFYEVLDTFIILAKGKVSSPLQTYHHAGAMICMWAGMRYMSPPIWMFVLVNSGIHTLMYTYYTLSACSVRVPTPLKRSLTSLQIAQFVIGLSFAVAHSFIEYTMPVVSIISRDPHSSDAATSSLDSASSSLLMPDDASAALALSAAKDVAVTLLTHLQSFLIRAVSYSPLISDSEQVPIVDDTPSAPLVDATTAVTAEPSSAMHDYIYSTQSVRCISASGATIAIWVNAIYLVPLIWLFARFFRRSYIWLNKTGPSPVVPAVKKALHESASSVAAEVRSEDAEPAVNVESEVKEKIEQMAADDFLSEQRSEAKSVLGIDPESTVDATKSEPEPQASPELESVPDSSDSRADPEGECEAMREVTPELVDVPKPPESEPEMVPKAEPDAEAEAEVETKEGSEADAVPVGVKREATPEHERQSQDNTSKVEP